MAWSQGLECPEVKGSEPCIIYWLLSCRGLFPKAQTEIISLQNGCSDGNNSQLQLSTLTSDEQESLREERLLISLTIFQGMLASKNCSVFEQKKSITPLKIVFSSSGNVKSWVSINLFHFNFSALFLRRWCMLQSLAAWYSLPSNMKFTLRKLRRVEQIEFGPYLG